jgi:hypothetical protein
MSSMSWLASNNTSLFFFFKIHLQYLDNILYAKKIETNNIVHAHI